MESNSKENLKELRPTEDFAFKGIYEQSEINTSYECNE